jgi:hypothetical protein
MANKNTSKGSVNIANVPSQSAQIVKVRPNGNILVTEKNRNKVINTSVVEEIIYDAAGRPTAMSVTTKSVKDKTAVIEKAVINRKGEVVKEKVREKTKPHVTEITVVTPYTSPDFEVQTPSTPYNPGGVITQGNQVRTYPEIDNDGQIVPPVDTTDVVYQQIGSLASTANGAILAQTFLSPKDGILVEVEVKITDLGNAGDLKCMICSTTPSGEPFLFETFAQTTVAYADLETGWLSIDVEPIYLQKGVLYAIVLQSTGSHTMETAVGGKFSQGTLFTSTDGVYHRGSLEVDLGFRLYFAEFPNTNMAITMNPLDLTGGIGGCSFRWFEVVPSGCARVIEGLIDNVWTDLASDSEDYPFDNLPAQVLMQMKLTGTKDLMPLTWYDVSRQTTFRSRTDFVGVSNLMTAAGACTSAKVTVTLNRFVEADHDCIIKLMKADNTIITAAGVTDIATENPDVIQRVATFTFSSLTQFRWRIEGATNSALSTFGVQEVLWEVS